MRRIAGCFLGDSEVEVVEDGGTFYLYVDEKIAGEFGDMREALDRFEEIVLELKRSGRLKIPKEV